MYQRLPLLLVLALLALAPCARAQDPCDLDGDQAITIIDLGILYDVAFGLVPAGPGHDLDGDGTVNVVDIMVWAMHCYDRIVGDLDGDGSYDVVDLMLLIDEFWADDPDPAADLNGDGSVDVVDLLIEINIVQEAMAR